MVCANLREISRSFLRESSRLRIFVRGVNAKKELFSWADLFIYLRIIVLGALGCLKAYVYVNWIQVYN